MVTFEWLMREAPKTEGEALAIRDKAMSNPLLKGTLISEDAKAICLYLPLTSKDLSYRVYSELKEKIAEFEGDEKYHITGLPVAEDTFGVEMFIQMAISAPLAIVVIFILMLLLIGFGFPVHIMSSMIPIFLMPIAVVDSVHILSEFFDRYTPEAGREKTVQEVMDNLFVAMLYTSLKSAGGFTYSKAKPILVVMLAITAVAVWGITRIRINDNPVKWFSKGHPIRQADIELNRHFGGTYMAYLVLESAEEEGGDIGGFVEVIGRRLADRQKELAGDYPKMGEAVAEAQKLLADMDATGLSRDEVLERFGEAANGKVDAAEDDDLADAWYEIADCADLERERAKAFKRPDVLEYVAGQQKHLDEMEVVGKSNSVSDVVRKVYQELIDGKEENYRIPDSSAAVAQCLLQFQSSHNPDDLWHLVTWDYSAANVWIQLTSGDNKDMQEVVDAVDAYITDNKPPVALEHNWAGLTFINTVWQDKMVRGMLRSFMGSFVIVFLMMTVLFRSPLWGLCV